jgi:hypothetical protein
MASRRAALKTCLSAVHHAVGLPLTLLLTVFVRLIIYLCAGHRLVLERLKVRRGVPWLVAPGRTKPHHRLPDGCAVRPCLRTRARVRAPAEHTPARSQIMASGRLICTSRRACHAWAPHCATPCRSSAYWTDTPGV